MERSSPLGDSNGTDPGSDPISAVEGEKPSPGRWPWWRLRVTYQIYPLSYQDSDGDGRGDLPGLLSRLDHLSRLGVGAVWLGPVFASPMLDFGYDIADFTAIDPCFGRMEDFDRLVTALHERDIRLILDFVPNHTSDRHPWFEESRSSGHNPKRDWYIWRDPGPDGGPPNNWLSRFGGSAWEWDEATGQYYYHAFLKEQPDLNWRNPEVRAAMHDVLRFWLDRGVDGFRIDAAAVIVEDALERDEPPNPDYGPDVPPPERYERIYTDSRPTALAYHSEIRRVVDEFPDRVLLAEVDTDPDKVAGFYGDHGDRLHLPLNYRLLDTEWTAAAVERTIRDYLDSLPEGACPDWVIGSHDKKRIAGRIGPDQARIAAMLALTLPGVPIIYAGDEIGMTDVRIPPGEALDPFERLVPGYGLDRDPYRAPMRWTPGPGAGFTTGEPWLPLGEGVESRNVETQAGQPRSILNLYRALIALRNARPVLSVGEYEALGRFGEALAYRRRLDGRDLTVALNFSDSPQTVPFSGSARVLLSTHLDGSGSRFDGVVRLRPNEGLILARDP